MKNLVLGVALSLFTATASLATTYRIDVTGSLTDGFYGGSVIYDQNYNQVGGAWRFTFDELEALGQGTYLDRPSDLTGSALYDPKGAASGKSFSNCSGLLDIVCGTFDSWPSVSGTLDPQSLEFSFDFVAYFGSMSFGNDQLRYVDDRSAGFGIGDLIYMGPRSFGYGYTLTFDSVTVSAIPVPPGVALGLTSVAALGALGALRRRAA